ncbi:oleosin 1-like [Rosa sericea]
MRSSSTRTSSRLNTCLPTSHPSLYITNPHTSSPPSLAKPISSKTLFCLFIHTFPQLVSLHSSKMAEHHQQYQQSHPSQGQQGLQHQQTKSYQVAKAATAVTAGGSLLVLSGLVLAGTVICLTIATPLLVIFSPVLVPAVITVALIMTGFLASGGFGVAAISVLSWIYKYVTGSHPPGSEQLDSARHKLAGKARDMKDRAEQFGQQHMGSDRGQHGQHQSS